LVSVFRRGVAGQKRQEVQMGNSKGTGAARPTERSTPNAAKPARLPSVPVELTAVERAVVERYHARQAAAPTPPLMVSGEGEDKKFTYGHPDQGVGQVLAMDAMGTASPAFFSGVLQQLAMIGGSTEEPTVERLNFLRSLVRGVGPRDEIEGMLAVEMAAVHVAMMRAAGRLARSAASADYQVASDAFNKMARTFAAQIETLKRYRSTGEQVVKVQHAHVVVNDGGQAVVAGNIRGGADGKLEGQPLEPTVSLPAASTALFGDEQAVSTAMPSAGGSRLVGVPVPRGGGRRAQRRG
jgi:hypothetical protein